MANTFNLGNGSWAQKTEKLLAYNAENDNYKPLPFDFDRASSATRVNKQGLIETVSTDKPRIDFLNNTKGHLLLEPQSQNTSTYSNDFTQGDIFNQSDNPSNSNSFLTSNQATSPSGANDAWLLKDNGGGGNGSVSVNYTSSNVNSNDNNIVSIFVKKALSNNFFYIITSGFDSTANGSSYFNIENGTLGTISEKHTAKIEDYGNGWYRCSIVFQTTTDTVGAVRFRVANQDNISFVPLDGTNGVYLFGLQCEASATQNYVTSYIPTLGSAVTRSGETLVQDNMLTSLFNRQAMAFYLEVESLANDSETKAITINDGSGADRFVLQLTGNQISTFTISSLGTTGFSIAAPNTDTTQTNKVAASFNASNGYLYINGTQIDVDTISNVIGDDLSKISFGNHSLINNIFYGKIKDYKIYNTALTPAELTALTS
jgi:hypothetical protein